MSGSDLLDDWVRYVQAKAREVIEQFGPRPPGSDAETRAQQLVASELRTWTTGEVRVEPFAVAAGAFMSVPLITGVLLAAAIACHWVSPWVAVGFSGAAVVVFVIEFVFYRQLLDPLFPKRVSHNVVAHQPPSGAISQRVVLNAHCDAAYEWRWHYRFPRLFPGMLCYGVACLAAVFLSDVAMLVVSSGGAERSVAWLPVAILQLACVPGALFGIGFASFGRVSPGANDDLSGVFAVLGLARHLRLAGIRLQRTELVCLITGSEEAGLRGAAAFAKRHRQEWRDVETLLIAVDTLRDLAHLHVYRRDRNGTIRHDPGVCALLHDAGRRCGLDLGYASVYLGSTDAAAFTLAGIRSASLCAMDPHPADYYHNRRDRWDNMSPACLRKGCEIILEAVQWYDRHGLGPPEQRGL